LLSGKTVMGVVDNGYWCDIGDIHSYRMANLRYTDGGNTVGKDCFIPTGTAQGSVFLDRVRIGQGSRIENSVICSDVTVGRSCVIGEGSVIGRGSVIGEGCVLFDGTVLDAESEIPAGSTVRGGSSLDRRAIVSMLDGDGLTVRRELVSPSVMMKLGGAIAEAVGGGRIGIMNDGGRDSVRVTSALLRGIGMRGGESMLLGEGFEAAASYGAPCMSLDLSVMVAESDGEIRLRFYDRNGLYPTRAFERALLSAVGKNDNDAGAGRRLSSCELVNDYYYPMLIKNRCDLEGYKVNIKRQNRASELLTRVLVRLGAKVGDEGIRLSVSDDGFSLSAEQDGVTADDWHIKALIVRYLIRDNAALPVTSPAVLRDLCRFRIKTYSHCPDGDAEDDARRLALKHPELIHAVAAAAELCAMLSATGKSLGELLSRLPSFAYTSYTLRTNDKGRLSILTSLGEPAGDGMISEYAYGSVRIVPVKDGYRLFSEAVSTEYASELTAMSEREIKRLLEENKK
jgi:mannose-1-phosphate guanylyltransferase/phosphomannomutase